MGVRSIRRLAPLLGLLIVVVSVASAGAFGHGTATPKVVGSATAGKAAFTTAGCGACHTLKAAKSKGTIGPNLDTESLTEAKIVTQITQGGYAVMGAAAKKTYPFPMSAFKGKLTTAQIQNIAAFVFTKRTGGKPATTTSTTTASTPLSGGTTPTTSTSTASSGGGGNSAAPSGPDGCPGGTSIQANITTTGGDGDVDDSGQQSDGDGCV